MAFRRRFRRRFRRSPYDIQTVLLCRNALTVPLPSTCDDPFDDAIELVGAGMLAPGQINPAGRYTKGVTFGGMHFQCELGLNPFVGTNTSITGVIDVVSIWEAVVVLPYAQGFQGIPAYLPNLSQSLFTVGDYADRVLWKRLSYLKFTSVNLLGASGNGLAAQITNEHTAAGPQVVRAKATLDERHGLFYCTSVVSGQTDAGPLILGRDAWFKIAVKERRR